MRGDHEKIVDPDLILAKDKLFKNWHAGTNYVCFDCRYNSKGGSPCPHCGNELYNVGYTARVPGKTHDAKWKKFEKLFKPKNFKHVRIPEPEPAKVHEKYKWLCLLCEREFNIPDRPELRTAPDSLQLILCDSCYDKVFEHMCSKKDECKPSNKNKISKKKRCPKCVTQNAPRIAKKLKAIEAVKKLG